MGNKNKLPDMLTKEQLLKLFECMLTPKCIIACFVALMLGLRVSEVCKILILDIDFEKRVVKIRDSKDPNRKKHKGYGKDRIVPIPEIAVSPMKTWIKINQGGKWFLPSMKSPDMHLRAKTLHRWFAEARKEAGLDEVDYVVKYNKKTKFRESSPVYKYRFHHFRHFYAQYVYEKTRDLYAVADLLGHNQITTTQVYAKVSSKTKKDTINYAFNIPIRTRIQIDNPKNAPDYAIPPIAKREKSPIEILEERFARGDISDIDFQNKLRLLKVGKEYLKKEERIEEENQKIEKTHDKREDES